MVVFLVSGGGISSNGVNLVTVSDGGGDISHVCGCGGDIGDSSSGDNSGGDDGDEGVVVVTLVVMMGVAVATVLMVTVVMVVIVTLECLSWP